MKKKVGVKDFTFVMVLVATLFTSVVVLQNRKALIDKSSAKKTEVEDIALSPGWNMISTSLETDLDAKTLCGQLTSGDSVCRFRDQYQCWYCNTTIPINVNFSIQANEGYFVYSGSVANLNFSGIKSYDVSLAEGSVMAGFPKASQQKIMASELCGRYPSTDLNVVKILKYKHLVANDYYYEKDCGDPNSDDFVIESGAGYWVTSELITKPGSSKNLKFKPSVPSSN